MPTIPQWEPWTLVYVYNHAVFLILMVIGLTGLVTMAIPAFGRHGHGHPTGAHPAHGGVHGGGGHAGDHLLGTRNTAGADAAGHHGETGGGRAGRASDMIAADLAGSSRLRLVPSPRWICTVFALYGAFGNALVHATHLPLVIAALFAALPALLVERFVVRPVWNLLFRFQAEPSSPMEELMFAEARAVVPFRNGRGIVSTLRDGRVVQLAAQLTAEQATAPVKVGDLLRIELVDARRERVTVSVLRG